MSGVWEIEAATPQEIVLPDGRPAWRYGVLDDVGPTTTMGAGACLEVVLRRFGLPPVSPPVPPTLRGLALALRTAGLETRIQMGDALDDLVHNFTLGAGIMLLVNQPAFVGDDEANRLVLVAAVACASVPGEGAGEFLGAYLAEPPAAPVFVSAADMLRCWLQPGGFMLTANWPQ